MMKIKYLLVFVLVPLLAFAGSKASTQELLDNLKSSDASKREKAARELGERGEKLGLEALVTATTDKDQKVAHAAVLAIGKINDPGKVSGLSQAVRNTHGKAQKEAMHLLIEHYIPSRDQNAFQELWNTLEDLFNPPHPVVAEPWTQVHAEAVDSILFVMDDKSSENRIEAAASLGILRAQQAIPRLSFYLQSPNPDMVRTCIRSIGYIGKQESGSALVPLLKHNDKEIVQDAVRVLGQLRYHGAIPEIQKFLDYGRDKELELVALQALSRIGNPTSEPTMKRYFVSNKNELRRFAIEGFGRMKLNGYREVLVREFQREDSRQTKLAICFSLFALGEKAYIDTLVRSLDDRLYKDQVREYLAELGDAAVPKVAEYLKISDKEFKLRVIRALGDMHQPSAITYLEPYVKDKNIDVAQAATDAIRELKKIQGLSEV